MVESCAIALVLTAIFWLAVDNLSGADLRKLFAEIFLYAVAISAPAMMLLPQVYLAVTNRGRIAQWGIFVAAFSLICAAGTMIGSALLMGFHLETGAPFQTVFLVSFRKTIIFGLLVGVIHTSFVLLRHELRDTQLALRT